MYSCCPCVHSARRRKRMPSFASAGKISSLSSRYWRSTMPCARAATWRKTSSGVRPSGPAAAAPSLICSFTLETRISKNSSRFDETMQRNFSRSSSGTDLSSACASTRRLNSRACSSRLRKCSGEWRCTRFGSALAAFGFLAMRMAGLCDRSVTRADGILSLVNQYTTLGAVDLGSNSFHLAIGRVVDDQIYPLDSLKETVRLGTGLTAERTLDPDAQERALGALKRFSERLAGMPRETVRVVGTNALRVAKNASAFLRRAEQTLGFPIEVIPGREEARLIYVGVVHSLPLADHNRLVVDIGGGSTEFIVGHKLSAKAMESLYMGCVSYSQRYFPDGRIEKKSMKQAELAAREQVQTLAARYERLGWREAVGSSGTARSIAEILQKNGQAERGITDAGLDWLREELLAAGDFRKLSIAGLREDRVPVVTGGVAIMKAVFDELGLHRMTVAEGALRDGVLWDLLGRVHHRDIREVTVDQFVKRYHVDQAQSHRVGTLARALARDLESEGFTFAP